MFRAAALSAVLLLPFAACTTLPVGGDHPYERDVALPADVTAALVTATLRQQFPFADPLACSAGAPAQRTTTGFAVVLEQNAGSAWLPVADHRLRIVAVPGAAAVDIDARPLDERHRLGSLGGAAVRRIVVAIDGDGTDACRVSGSLPAPVAACLAAALDRTFALANDDRAPLLGLSEPNLRAFVRHRLLAAADEHLQQGRSRLAAERLHTAHRFVDGDVAFQRALACRAGRAGDVDFAAEQLLQALLAAGDPTTRAGVARDLADLGADPRDTATPLAEDATEARLHTARRARAEPVRDYRRLSAVHAERRDEMGELACVLLAREHDARDPFLAAGDGKGATLRRLPFDLGRRMQESRVAASAPFQAPLTPQDAVAAPSR